MLPLPVSKRPLSDRFIPHTHMECDFFATNLYALVLKLLDATDLTLGGHRMAPTLPYLELVRANGPSATRRTDPSQTVSSVISAVLNIVLVAQHARICGAKHLASAEGACRRAARHRRSRSRGGQEARILHFPISTRGRRACRPVVGRAGRCYGTYGTAGRGLLL